MTTVTYKERRFTSAFVAECKVQSQLPESECDYAPQVEGVLACPESRRPKKKMKRGPAAHFAHVDEVAYFAHSGDPVPREAKRVTQSQLRGLNTNAVHIDDEGFLKEGPKKVSGFGQLRDLLGKD